MTTIGITGPNPKHKRRAYLLLLLLFLIPALYVEFVTVKAHSGHHPA